MKRAAWLIAAVLGVTLGVTWQRRLAAHEVLRTTVLFDREIVRVLNTHCVMCHAENNVSFPLETYEQTWLRGRKIRSQVLARHMPPWSAVPGYSEFSNDNGLTLRETQFVVSWVEGLGPRNAGTVFLNVMDPTAIPAPNVRAHADVGQWQLGEPSLTERLAETRVAAHASDVVKRTVIDLGLTKATSIRGLEYMPGDRRVVYGASFTLQENGQWLGSWTPWHPFVDLPEGVAYRLPAGSHVVADIHYRGIDEAVIDQGTLGLFASDPSSQKAPSDLKLASDKGVAAGDRVMRFQAEASLASEMSVLSLVPDVRPGMASVEVLARTPDGGTQILLFARDLLPEWPTPYIFKEPVRLPRGTRLFATANYGTGTAAAGTGGLRLTVSWYKN